ncbi:hypothetical protein V6N13_121496 [Hibiscus sabdariffa]|uniref:Uncharacterized protein n=1 Tax=Hibiscus sabdariffa TaxID=183260 RepID=A0ABR2PDZ9_9ROSI
MLERHGSPISNEKQPVTKRGRCEVESELTDVVEEEHMDAEFDTTMGDTENHNFLIDGQVHAKSPREESEQIENGDGTTKLSLWIPLWARQGREDSNHIQTMANCGKKPVVTLDNEQNYSILPQQHGEEIIELDVDTGDEQTATARAQTSKDRNVRVLPASIRNGSPKVQTITPVALKGTQRQGIKTKKKDDRGPIKPTLTANVFALISDLDRAKDADIARKMDVIQQNGEVQWRENSAYEQPRSSHGRN